MTIGLAVCLEDGALLIADGRIVKPFVANKKISDNKNKITRITETVASISLGVEMATDLALSYIKSNVIDASESPEAVIAEVERAAEKAWREFLSKLASDVDKRSLRLGLLVGGYLPKQSRGGFIGGVLCRPEGLCSIEIKINQNECFVLGGEEHDSRKMFPQVAGEEIGKLGVSYHDLPNAHIDAFLRSGTYTIRQIEKKSPIIGGEIRYSILRRGIEYVENISPY